MKLRRFARIVVMITLSAGALVAGESGVAVSTTVDCGGSAPPKAEGGSWMCTWSDEFDGTALSDDWELIPYGLGSACLFDDPDYVEVSGGYLSLLARRLPADHWCTTEWGLEYGGGGIQTQGQFAQRYGRFEMRAQLPAGNGFWPAFWMLPDDESYDGEIDILESYGGRVEQGGDVGDFTLHAPAGGPGPQRTCRVYPDQSSGFHTYTLEWRPGSMRAYYDGVLCANFTGMSDVGTAPPAFPGTFGKPYHLLLDLAVQPWWPPDSGTVFPAMMCIDYVRAWS